MASRRILKEGVADLVGKSHCIKKLERQNPEIRTGLLVLVSGLL
jgi:hypothetical protein